MAANSGAVIGSTAESGRSAVAAPAGTAPTALETATSEICSLEKHVADKNDNVLVR